MPSAHASHTTYASAPVPPKTPPSVRIAMDRVQLRCAQAEAAAKARRDAHAKAVATALLKFLAKALAKALFKAMIKR